MSHICLLLTTVLVFSRHTETRTVLMPVQLYSYCTLRVLTGGYCL